MKTLKELLEGKTLPVRVRYQYWDNDHWFECRYITSDGVYGHHEDGDADRYALDDGTALAKEWELYEPAQDPKRKHFYAMSGRGPVFYCTEEEVSREPRFERIPDPRCKCGGSDE